LRKTSAEAELAAMKSFIVKVRDTAVGKDDALDVCVGLMKEANAILCGKPSATKARSGLTEEECGEVESVRSLCGEFPGDRLNTLVAVIDRLTGAGSGS